MPFDVQGALAAGYSPQDVDGFQKAVAAGYSPQEVDAFLAGRQHAAAAPQAPVQIPSVSSSPLTALRNSAGSLVSGVGEFGGQIDSAINKYGPAWMTGGNQGPSAADQAVVQAGQALSGPQQYDGQSIHRLVNDVGQGNLKGAAYDALGGLASVAPAAAVAAVPGVGPAILGASGAGNTIQDRMQAQGQSSPSAGDVLAGVGSAALNAGLGPASSGVMRTVGPIIGAVGNPIARALARVAAGGAAGAVTGAGNYALDNAGTGQGNAQALLNATEEGAGTGSLAAATTGPAAALRGVLQSSSMNRAAGPDLQAYAKETADWNSAQQQAQAALMQQNPGLTPDQLRSASYIQAQKAGATPPTFDTLSPNAQRGLAQLGVLQMYQQRLQANSAGMGKDPSDIEPSTVFKDVLDDITRNLGQTSDLLKQNGLIDSTQAQNLNAAIAEAKKGNRNPGQGGQALGYFPTLRDTVQNLPIDPAYRNTMLMMLQMADVAEDNSWKQAAKGPLERNAGLISAGLGYGLGGLIGAHLGGDGMALEGLEGLGGLIGMTRHGMVQAGLRGLDKVMGNQLPPLLQNQAGIEDFAKANKLSAAVTPGDLMDIQQQLQQLRNVRPGMRPGIPPSPGGAAPSPGPAPGPTPNATGAPYPARQPMYTPSRPVPQAAPSAVPTPPTTPAMQSQAMLDGLQAQASAKQAQQQSVLDTLTKAMPLEGTTWQRAIAHNTGIPVQAMKDHLQGLVDNGLMPQATLDYLNGQDFLHGSLYGHLNDKFSGMALNGQGMQPAPVPAVDPNVRSPLAYQASVNTAHQVLNNIVSQNPDLARWASRLAGLKTTADRSAALDEMLGVVDDPAEKARRDAILRPLTAFGWKPSSGTPDPRASGAATSTAADRLRAVLRSTDYINKLR